MLKIVLTN